MKVLIAGDFAPRANLAKQIKEKRFSEVFPENIRKTIKSADFSFVNFESPIVEDGYKPIPKCGPNLRCTPEAAEAIRFAGFTGVTMANNHILDYGVEGLRKSVACCKKEGLYIVGVGENIEEAGKPLYLEKAGKTLAIINCCEHEYSIATHSEPGANPINPICQYYAIQEAKMKSDYVLVIVHGGHEMFQLPSPRMVESYRFFIDAGADAVVNHHQHCYSGYELYKGKPIVYGLGNFCFDYPNRREDIWYEGYMAQLELTENVNISIIPYKQYFDIEGIRLLTTYELNIFENRLSEINDIISDDNKLLKQIESYYNSCSQSERTIFEPYSGRLFYKLFKMGILPRVFKGIKLYKGLNHIECESHRDKLIFALHNV